MTKQKHACPINVVKQNQGTGKKVLDRTDEKPTGSQAPSGTKTGNPKNRIWSQADYDASPAIDLIINSLDISKTIQGAEIVNTMHEHFAHLILEELKEKGLPYWVLDGQTFTLKLTFMKERPEAQ